MSEQIQEELSEYEKFRLLKLVNSKDDDNLSAHFSNISANISMMSKSQREIKINSFHTSHQNEEDFKNIESDAKNNQLQQMTKKYLQLEEDYKELLKQFKAKEEQAQKYKRLYQQEINRERQTKQKLKNWVKQAKTNLNH